MQPIDFFKLPRPVQERIIGGVRGEFPPSPLARLAPKPSVPWPWLLLSVVGLSVFFTLCSRGFGALGPTGVQSTLYLFGYIAALFAALFGVLGASGAHIKRRLLPYPRGTFLYANRVLQTEAHPMKTLAIDPSVSVQAAQGAVVVLHARGKLVFPSQEPAAVVAAIDAVRGADEEGIAEHDPLHKPSFHSPLGESEPLARQVPVWVRFHWTVGLAVALLTSVGVFLVRNVQSDKRMFLVAREADNAESYRAYLEFGDKYREDVERVLLPRAELREAIEQGSAEAILEFEKTHQEAAIGREVQDAKRAALVAELQRREQAGDLVRVRSFLSDYPDSGLEPEVQLAIGRLYRTVGERVQGKSAEGTLAVAAALGWAEKKEPRATITWSPLPSKNLAQLEKVLARVPEFMGDANKPSTHLTPSELRARAARLGSELSTRIAAVIPPLYLAFSWSDAAPPAPESGPLLSITERVEWSGATLRSKKPRGVFVGLTYHYQVDLTVPGAKPFRQQVNITKRVTDAMLKAHAGENGFEAKLYAELHRQAHQELQEALLKSLFQTQ